MREEKLGTANPDVDDEKKRLGELLKEAGRVQSRKARSLENFLDANSHINTDGIKVWNGYLSVLSMNFMYHRIYLRENEWGKKNKKGRKRKAWGVLIEYWSGEHNILYWLRIALFCHAPWNYCGKLTTLHSMYCTHLKDF